MKLTKKVKTWIFVLYYVVSTVAFYKVCQPVDLVWLNRKLAPTVVQIKAIEGNKYGLGSGVYLNRDGLILTCAHVVSHPYTSLVITDYDGREYEARVIKLDEVHDLALICGLPTKHWAKLSKKEGPIGTKVVAIGHPLGFSWTFTNGIISGKDRFAHHLIQSNVVINPGNSGGPLFDLSGHLVGLNEAIFGAMPMVGWTGQSLAINIDDIKDFLKDIY